MRIQHGSEGGGSSCEAPRRWSASTRLYAQAVDALNAEPVTPLLV